MDIYWCCAQANFSHDADYRIMTEIKGKTILKMSSTVNPRLDVKGMIHRLQQLAAHSSNWQQSAVPGKATGSQHVQTCRQDRALCCQVGLKAFP